MAFVQGLIIGHATTREEHFQAFIDKSIDAIACPNSDISAIRGHNYKEAREQVGLVWAANLDSWGYQSGEDFVDAMADLLESMYGLAHPAQTK